MGIFNFGKKGKSDITKNALVYSSKKPLDNGGYVSEALKGLVSSNKIKFPADLGEAHPFDFTLTEQLVKKFGLSSAIVDKHIDFIMSGGMQVSCEDERATQIIQDFMRDQDFDSLMRAWFREAFIKGNGFLELGSGDNDSIDELKLLNANYMYVERDEQGKVISYKQYVKAIEGYSANNNSKKDTTDFKPKEIAHLAINVYGDSAYGLGLVYLLIPVINEVIGGRQELHKVMKRKAENPLIFVMGDRATDDLPDATKINELGQKLESLEGRNNWVITDYIKPMTLDFGNVSEKFQLMIDNDLDVLYSSAQVPAVLMGGKASIPEGLAKVQMRAFELRIQSLREEIEKIIEDQIFKRVLNANGLDENVEIEWGIPSRDEKNATAQILIEATKNPFISNGLRDQMEIKLGGLFDIPEDEVQTDEDEREKEEGKDKQPVVPEERKSLESYKGCCEKVVTEDISVQEWVGFNYKKYNEDVLEEVKFDRFDDLRAVTKTDIKAGLLGSSDIEKLRTTIYEGFDENITIREMKDRLEKRVDFKDRLRMKDGSIVTRDGTPVLALPAALRSIMITRTETVRLANLGAKKNYKKNGIDKVRWIAAMSDRTCPACSDLNGLIMPLRNSITPPLHPMCRCTLSPVVE